MSSGAAILRRGLSPTDHFTIISNRAVRDERLSWKARGMLVYLLSHSTGWEIGVEKLIEASPEGRAAVRAGLKELEDLGYLERRKEHDKHGRFIGWVYEVQDQPADRPDDREWEKPTVEFSHGGSVENRSVGTALIEDQTEDQKTPRAASLSPELSKLADAMAKGYHSRNKLEGFMGILNCVRRALSAEYRPDEVEAALKKIELEGQTVTAWRLKNVLESSQERRDARMFDENGMLR